MMIWNKWTLPLLALMDLMKFLTLKCSITNRILKNKSNKIPQLKFNKLNLFNRQRLKKKRYKKTSLPQPISNLLINHQKALLFKTEVNLNFS